MDDNGNRYALHALRERRASLYGELRECERRMRYLKEMLGHLDATLGLFDPEGNPKAIRAKRPYKRVKLFGAGALSRQMSIGHFRRRISPSVSAIHEQKQWRSIPRRRGSWQYRI